MLFLLSLLLVNDFDATNFHINQITSTKQILTIPKDYKSIAPYSINWNSQKIRLSFYSIPNENES